MNCIRIAVASFATTVAVPSMAMAGSFDARGNFRHDESAVSTVDFEADFERYVPSDAPAKCNGPMSTPTSAEDALEGHHFTVVQATPDCAERIVVKLPGGPGSYRASAWTRHGAASATFVAIHTNESGLGLATASMFPTGRMTSDGWVELASNELSIDGSALTASYVKVVDFAAANGIDVDAIEVVRAGSYSAPVACHGHADAACGAEGSCVFERCQWGRSYVPPLPDPAVRDDVVDTLRGRLALFFGGKSTRELFLGDALLDVEGMRSAQSAWEFWGAYGRAIRALHDWHTHTSIGAQSGGPSRRLNACFFEGDADISHSTWPKDPAYADVLVSHAGALGALGLRTGDRLLAVDGLHPLAWTETLTDADGNARQASDPKNFADGAERLGGPFWTGGALLLKYAHNFTILRCGAATGTCASEPETIAIADVPNEPGGDDVACDNRPFYHLGPDSPKPNHYVFGSFYRGRVEATSDDEAIFGMVWDTLYGGGKPDSDVNTQIAKAIADWKVGAKGVILDHRAGNGGTLDAAENLTKLVRPAEPWAIVRMPIAFGGYGGPANQADGQALFDAWKFSSIAYVVGASDYAKNLPVALITHRDGSASDYMPFGMKGGPHVRLFGPHGTAGAFSTYVSFTYWGALSIQFASGDTIAHDGQALIGHGVEPDVVVWPKQSDLLAGKDTLHEAALAWLRQELTK